MAYVYLAFAPLVWGGAFIVGKVLVAEVDPLMVAWLRFVVASGLFAAIGWWKARRGRATDPRGRGRVGDGPPGRWVYALLGLTGIFGYNLFFFCGLTYTTATESSLIIASSPVVVALIGRIFLGERLSAPKAAGVALSTAGVVLVILGAVGAAAGGGEEVRAASRLLGDLLMLGGVLSWAAYSALGKRLLRQVSPLEATSRASYWGTLFLSGAVVLRAAFADAVGGVSGLAGGISTLAELEAAALAGVGYLSVVCTVLGFVAWYKGLSAVEVSGAAAFLNLVPVSTLVIALLALGERPTWVQLAGGLLVVGGVTLVSVAGTAAAGRRPDAAWRRAS
ncbi:MAG TPA: hypothetical protein DHW14_07590 [Clostridiales bacterium]|nr:hypothetical protein [Clostridiales bacterium]